MSELTHARLRELLRYEPVTGKMFRRRRIGSRGRPIGGQETGTRGTHGYYVVAADGKIHRRARLAFFYMAGRWPTPCVDHINRDCTDDRWANLREASYTRNSFNAKACAHSQTGIRGVCPDRGGYKATAQWCGRRKMRRFKTLEEAVAQRKVWELELDG